MISIIEIRIKIIIGISLFLIDEALRLVSEEISFLEFSTAPKQDGGYDTNDKPHAPFFIVIHNLSFLDYCITGEKYSGDIARSRMTSVSFVVISPLILFVVSPLSIVILL